MGGGHLGGIELPQLLAQLLLLSRVDRAAARARGAAATAHDSLGHVHAAARPLLLLYRLLPTATLGPVVALARVSALAVVTLAVSLRGVWCRRRGRGRRRVS